ncbi:hypothetical protein PF011_g21332 [Phytophthora fragariae]|uniref:Nucleotide-diphospho-sugar transferase domain-containing protein n=1 Tax=Phytophthora fragariae TaxID=53985 RepID=A0A6A3IRH9_9STRA|nr:hypothetical protein PF011_g21332 [Phytophthora fragariae]
MKDLQVRLQLWRLQAAKRGREGYGRGLVFTAVSVLLIILGRNALVAPREKFIRVVPPPTSVLHPNTPMQASLNSDITFSSRALAGRFTEYSELFPQHGKDEPGQHYRIENTELLAQEENRQNDSLLLITVFNGADSWGTNRTVADFFPLVESMNFPNEKTSIALLTSSEIAFEEVKGIFADQIHQYAQLSVIFRNDFTPQGLTRDNRHDDNLQANRRRMIARYRNYALLSTLQTWHQHVVWLDADIVSIPPDLVFKMAQSGLDIVHPLCARGNWYVYDLNAWVGHRKVRPALPTGFVPGPLSLVAQCFTCEQTSIAKESSSPHITLLAANGAQRATMVLKPKEFVTARIS